MNPPGPPLFALVAAVAVILVVIGLRHPQLTVVYLLATMFARLALPSVVADPFVLAFAGLLAAVALWLSTRPGALPRLGWLEGCMALYLCWNVYSMLAPHKYGPVYPFTGDTLSVYRFILTGTAIPFAAYLVGRTIYRTARSVTILLWVIVGFGAYSALVSVLQFAAPSLVWPRYIVDNPLWPDRANGVFNQPVVNGLVLIAGFVALLILAGTRSRSTWWGTCSTVAGTGAFATGVYLTHTRAVWLCFLIVVLTGLIFARGIRLGFALTLTATVVAVAANWSTFTSSDRRAGGVGSVNEVDDRLNSIATSLWAARREPLSGWGIGRFTAVNSYHHQQWSQDIPWLRGVGISSHFNELGILVELGAIGLVLWLAVVVLLVKRLLSAYRSLPVDGVCGRQLALLAIMLLGSLIVTGLTVDLRFFDFPNTLVYLLVGISVGFADRQGKDAPAESVGKLEPAHA